MKLTPLKQFIYTAVPFAVLGAAFKVMTLVEGLTEIRPANAIPIIAGLLFGPVGGLGCAAGNFIADFFGTMSIASVTGMIANFMAAFLPWKIWHLFNREKPNVHTWKNIFRYVVLSVISAMSVAWILSYGLELVTGYWVQDIYRYIFYNNAAFSTGLGLPLFIVFTSDSINVEAVMPKRHPEKERPAWYESAMHAAVILYAVTMAGILAGAFNGMHPGNSAVMKVLCIPAVLLLILICASPLYEKNQVEAL